MDTQPPVRIRLTFSDPTILTNSQRSQGMNNTWLLIEPLKRHRIIHDVINHLVNTFNLHTSCPNGILLFMEDFLLLPSESTQILKDNDIICVKRKVMSLGDAIEGGVNKREHLDNDMLLLANEEFDKETNGYQSESEEEKSEEPSPKKIASKKRKASTKLQSSKKRKKTSEVMDDIEDEVVSEDDIHDNVIHNDVCLPPKFISKKTKLNKEKKSAESETINVKVKSPSKAKGKKKQRFTEVEVVADDIDDGNDGGYLSRKITSKKTKPSEEAMKESSETNDENINDNVEGVEQPSTAPDGAKKGPSRSARRKKAKRQWRRELAKISQNPDTHLEPEVAKAENKEANGHLEGHLKQDKAVKSVDKNMVEQKGRNRNGNVDHEAVPCVVRPGHIRFEPLDDEDEDTKQTEVPNVAYHWNGITSKKKGQKWGIEKFSTFQRDDSQKASKEPSTVLTAEADTHTHVPVIDLNDLDQLPLYSSPKEGDVIAYRLLELSSSWTPELSSFRVGKISHYDGNFVVLMPVPEYPIVFDNMDEDGPENSPFKEDRSIPENSLYKEDGSLEIKFEALVDVRSVRQSNSDATKAPVSNGVNQTPQFDGKDSASIVKSSSKKLKPNVSKDPSPVVENKEGNTWNELAEVLSAKKSHLLETMSEEKKKDSEWNKWSYRALRGSCLGPTMALLRSSNGM